jgi:PilZ domain
MEVPERRTRRRLQSSFLVFSHCDSANGGISFNISEDGIALSAAYVLLEDRLIHLRVQFSATEWTELAGQIAWKSSSKREAGLRFVGLTDEVRQQIRLWLASERSVDEPHAQTHAIRLQRGKSRRERMRDWLFSRSSPPETPDQELSPALGLSKEAYDRMRNWIFREARLIEPLPAPKRWPDRRELSTGIDAEISSNELPAKRDVVTDGRIQNASLSIKLRAFSKASERDLEKAVLQEESQIVNNLPGAEAFAGVLDRRSHARAQIVPPGYVQLGETNGGIALNISEGGLAFTAARIVALDHLPSVRIQFPDSSNSIEATGRIVWRSASKKEAGLRFLGLSEDVHRQIRVWISQQAPPVISEQASPTLVGEHPQNRMGDRQF